MLPTCPGGPIRINSLQWQSCHSGSDTGHLFIWIHWELLVAAAGSAPLSQRLAFSIQVVCIHVFCIQVGCHLHEHLRNPLSTLAGLAQKIICKYVAGS